MTNLLVLKEKIVGIYKNFEYPILMVGKFILAILAFQYVNEKLGSVDRNRTGTVFIGDLCGCACVHICFDFCIGCAAASV